MPPRKSTAILCASILSFLALPPWIAFMYSACPRTKGILCLAHRSASQYQVKMHFHANRHVFSVGGYRFKEQLRGTRHVSVQHDLALRIQDTDVHRSGMQIDSAVVSVLLSVKSHDEVSSFKSVFGKHEHTKWYAQEGASMSINRVEKDARQIAPLTLRVSRQRRFAVECPQSRCSGHTI